MDVLKTRKLHAEIDLAGFRAHAAVVGLLQLIRELRRCGLLDPGAVDRIRDVVIDEFTLSRSRHTPEREFRERLKTRLDRLLDHGDDA